MQLEWVNENGNHSQARNEELEVANQKFQKHINDLQQKLNKVIEENVQLRSSIQRSPPVTTPTSPLPPISELNAGKEEEEEEEKGEGEGEGNEEEELGPKDIYAVVDKSKVSSLLLGS